jgi:hypothetical protein
MVAVGKSYRKLRCGDIQRKLMGFRDEICVFTKESNDVFVIL